MQQKAVDLCEQHTSELGLQINCNSVDSVIR
jgi:hypothetical protein